MIVDVQDESTNPLHRRQGAAKRKSSFDMISLLQFAVIFMGYITTVYWMNMKIDKNKSDVEMSIRALKEANVGAQNDVKILGEEVSSLKATMKELRKELMKTLSKDDVSELIDAAMSKKNPEDEEDAMSKDIKHIKKTLEVMKSNENDMQKSITEVQRVDASAKIRQLEESLAELRRMMGIGGTPQYNPSPVDPAIQQQQQQAMRDYQQASLGNNVAQNQQRSYAEQAPAQQQLPNYGVGAVKEDMAPEIPDPWPDASDEERNAHRQEKTKEEFLHSWNAYKKYAWGHDELCPVTRSYKDWGSSRSKGLALTAIDALSTLWLMGLKEEFNDAVSLIVEKVDFNQDIKVSAFESTIRVVGSLLSAYELSGEKDKRLLKKAQEMADKILVAYNTTSGIPHQTVNLRKKTHWSPDWTAGAAILSEFGSVQLEFRTLSYHTKNPLYDMKVTHLMNVLKSKCPTDMLCPTMFDTIIAEFRDDHVTLGALGDSFYEYLVKQYILTGNTELQYRKMSLTALESIVTHLLRYSDPSRQAYVAERLGGQLDTRMDELACFTGGMFALAAMKIPDSGSAKTYRRVAQDLTETCFKMFKYQQTGIAPEIVEFVGGRDMTPSSAYYLLRPETSESIFYLWRLTKAQKYRDMQWFIFSHIMKYCKVETGGYSGIQHVNIVPPQHDDQQQSFWLAETLKYVYMTFSDDDVLDLDEWVLNTEAHPLKIRKRDPMDIWKEWEEEHNGEMPWYPPFLEGVPQTETKRMHQYRVANNLKRIAPRDPLSIDEPMDDEDAQNQLKAQQRQEEEQFAKEAAAQQEADRKMEEEQRKKRKEAEAAQKAKAKKKPVATPRNVHKVHHDKIRKISRHISAHVKRSSNQADGDNNEDDENSDDKKSDSDDGASLDDADGNNSGGGGGGGGGGGSGDTANNKNDGNDGEE